MLWVSPTAICAMAASVSATGPPSPMFSPAAVHCTPAAVSRAPRAGSPGHWWDSPQPAAITALCRPALVSRPALHRIGRQAGLRTSLINQRQYLLGRRIQARGLPGRRGLLTR